MVEPPVSHCVSHGIEEWGNKGVESGVSAFRDAGQVGRPAHVEQQTNRREIENDRGLIRPLEPRAHHKVRRQVW